jgi:peptidoglycan hydrolase-like protein with peptidoglycan-binding domain
MDLVKTLLVYMMVLVGSATQASPAVTPIPPDAVITPTPYVTATPAPTASPSPTPAPTVNNKYTTLYVGDKGGNVRKLQTRLKELGYLTDKVDGAYGQSGRHRRQGHADADV